MALLPPILRPFHPSTQNCHALSFSSQWRRSMASYSTHVEPNFMSASLSPPFALRFSRRSVCAGPSLSCRWYFTNFYGPEPEAFSFHSLTTTPRQKNLRTSQGRIAMSDKNRHLQKAVARSVYSASGVTHSTPSKTDSWQQESADVAERGSGNGASYAKGRQRQGEVATEGMVDMVTLGNMCVDVFVNVEELPPEEREAKLQYMKKLMETTPDESCWESGGFTNSLIAGSRLGLKCSAIGHLGNDVFGHFLKRILREEGIHFHEFYRGGDPAMSAQLPETGWETSAQLPCAEEEFNGEGSDAGKAEEVFRNGGGVAGRAALDSDTELDTDWRTDTRTDSDSDTKSDTNPHVETLYCWVMIDPSHGHAFCSRFDFDTSPMFGSLTSLPPPLEEVVRGSRALFINGFIFDEVPTRGIIAAARFARESGAAVFFDPGPRTFVLTKGEGCEREALERVIGVSSVLLLTTEEAEALTGMFDPWESAHTLLHSHRGGGGGGGSGVGVGGVLEWVVVKRGSLGCVLATPLGLFTMPGFRVPCVDTVGCGDSFAAAVLLGFTRGWGEQCVMALANAVGAATAMGKGAGRNVARMETVEKILTELQVDGSGAVDPSKLNQCELGREAVFGFEPRGEGGNGTRHSGGGRGAEGRQLLSLKEAVQGALDLLRTSRRGAEAML